MDLRCFFGTIFSVLRSDGFIKVETRVIAKELILITALQAIIKPRRQ